MVHESGSLVSAFSWPLNFTLFLIFMIGFSVDSWLAWRAWKE